MDRDHGNASAHRLDDSCSLSVGDGSRPKRGPGRKQAGRDDRCEGIGSQRSYEGRISGACGYRVLKLLFALMGGIDSAITPPRLKIWVHQPTKAAVMRVPHAQIILSIDQSLEE